MQIGRLSGGRGFGTFEKTTTSVRILKEAVIGAAGRFAQVKSCKFARRASEPLLGFKFAFEREEDLAECAGCHSKLNGTDISSALS